MKIIKRGNPDPWWVGAQGECFYCKTVVQIEVEDEIEDRSNQRDGDQVSVECPVCPEAKVQDADAAPNRIMIYRGGGNPYHHG